MQNVVLKKVTHTTLYMRPTVTLLKILYKSCLSVRVRTSIICHRYKGQPSGGAGEGYLLPYFLYQPVHAVCTVNSS